MMTRVRGIGRFLVLYIVVLIPLLLSSLLAGRYTFLHAKQQEEKRMQMILDNVAEELDEWFEDFREQGAALGEIRELSPASVLGDSIAAGNAIKYINDSMLFDSRIQDVAVWYGVGKAYTARGIVNVQTWLNTTLRCTEESVLRAVEAMSSPSAAVTMLRTKENDTLLMYHIPGRKYASEFYFGVQFLISPDRFWEMFEAGAYGTQSVLCLSVGGEEICFQAADGKGAIIEKEIFDDWRQSARVISMTRAIKGMEVSLFFDPTVSWMQLRHFQMINILLLAVGTGLSFLLSLTFSNRRWNRFQSLVGDRRLKTAAGPDKKWFSDEIDYIRLLLKQSEQESEQVSRNAMQYRNDLCRKIAEVIFHGLVVRAEDISHLLEVCGLEMGGDYFYLGGALLKKKEEIQKLEPLLEDMLYCTDTTGGQPVVLFMGESAVLDAECTERKRMAKEILRHLQSAGVSCQGLAFSQVYNSLPLINYAWLEIMVLLKNTPWPNGVVECWDKYVSPGSGHLKEQQTELLEGFLDAMKHRDQKLAQMVLEALRTEGKENVCDMQYLRYCIRQSVILAMRARDQEPDVRLLQKVLAVNPEVEEGFYEKIFKILPSVCGQDRYSEQLREAVRYVQENYCRYDLSLDEVAAHVNLSKTQMSKLFKAQMDVNYLDFLTRLRMEKAKRLLTETEEPIKSILSAVGYIDRASFSKKFKACYGVSPAQYRGWEMERESADF